MDVNQLDRSIGDLTASLGDPTRRGIYLTVRASSEPLTTSDIASIFDIHPNVARHHLDRLAGDGYLRVTRRRPEGRGGPGAGRPAKWYEATEKEIDVNLPTRRFDLLAELLLRLVDRLAPADLAAVAEDVGRDYGRDLAAQIGLPEEPGYEQAVRAVAQAMTMAGFEVDAEPDAHRLLTSFCPFGTTAIAHPEVVCSLDRGMVTGLLEALHQPWRAVTLTPHPGEAEECVTSL
jgi:predicted ArsR family transcriptional regulator